MRHDEIDARGPVWEKMRADGDLLGRIQVVRRGFFSGAVTREDVRMVSRSSVNDLMRKVEVQGTKGIAHSYMCGTCTLKATTADGREISFDGKTSDAGLLLATKSRNC